MIIVKTDSTFKLPPVDDKSKKIMKSLRDRRSVFYGLEVYNLWGTLCSIVSFDCHWNKKDYYLSFVTRIAFNVLVVT